MTVIAVDVGEMKTLQLTLASDTGQMHVERGLCQSSVPSHVQQIGAHVVGAQLSRRASEVPRDGNMVLRWTAGALREASKGFRRLRGHAGMPKLIIGLRAHDDSLNDTHDDAIDLPSDAVEDEPLLGRTPSGCRTTTRAG